MRSFPTLFASFARLFAGELVSSPLLMSYMTTLAASLARLFAGELVSSPFLMSYMTSFLMLLAADSLAAFAASLTTLFMFGICHNQSPFFTLNT